MTDWQDRVDAEIAAHTPGHGYNVVGVDPAQPAGEALYLVAHFDDADVAAKYAEQHEARSGDATHVYAAPGARADDFDESKHPRDANGKFGSGGEAPASEHAAPDHSPRTFPSPTAQNIGHTMDTNKDTQAMYFKDGKWAAERQPLHAAYTAAATRGVPKADGAPTVYMTGGGPASGKTVALLKNPDAGIPSRAQAAHVNPDDAKEALPEYHAALEAKDIRGAAFTHEESSVMTKASTAAAIGAGHNVVLDTTGDSGIDKLHAKVEQIRAQGAGRVVAHYATIDVNEALKRENARAAETGRKVNETFLRQTHKDVTATALGAIQRGTFDELHIYDNGVKFGEKPVHVASYTREGGLQVHDPARFEAFKARG